MITTTLLQNELQEMKRIHNRCQKRRASLICRSLHTRFEHGKPRPYTVVNGKPTYIAQKNTELLQNIVQSKALQQLQPRLARNITLLEQIVKDYTPLPDLFSADLTAPIIQTIRGTLAGTTQEKSRTAQALDYLHGELYPSLQHHTTDAEIRRWLSEPYDPNPIHPEQLFHRTPGGIYVRSKSELLLGTHFEYCHIPYKYEFPLYLEGNPVRPDFTILHPKTRKLIYWEHLGMMDIENYAMQNLQKLLRYFECGFLPYINLVVTYDQNGTLDMSQVEQILSALDF